MHGASAKTRWPLRPSRPRPTTCWRAWPIGARCSATRSRAEPRRSHASSARSALLQDHEAHGFELRLPHRVEHLDQGAVGRALVGDDLHVAPERLVRGALRDELEAIAVLLQDCEQGRDEKAVGPTLLLAGIDLAVAQ